MVGRYLYPISIGALRNNYNWHPKYDATKTAQTVLEELMDAQSHHSAASSKPKK